MEAIKLNNKENLIENYGLKPQLFYDIEGNLIENNGKDIKIEKTVDNKEIVYSLRLKKGIIGELGNKVLIDKENILSVKVEEKAKDKTPLSINKKETIKKLGLEDNEETEETIEYLIENEIPITEENINSFLMSKRYLSEIVDNLDLETSIKLLDRGIDIEEDPLQKIVEALGEIKNESKELSLLEILGLDRKLNYKEAEAIAKEVYGRKMGKDVYDSIIALHNEGVEINRENIEKIMEIMDKAYDLRDYEDERLIIAFKEDLDINMENLYKLKHSYKIGDLGENIATPLYEEFLVEKDRNIEDILMELNLEKNVENINLMRAFVHYDLDIDLKNYEEIIDMRKNLRELLDILDENSIAKLMDKEIDILNTDIKELIDIIKNETLDNKNIEIKESPEILKNIEELKTITDKELLQLIKSGEDFKIENLVEIKDTNLNLEQDLDIKTVEKAVTLNNIFNTLGELDSKTISFAVKRSNNICLNNLYEAKVHLKEIDEVLVETVNSIEESIIRQEYLNAKVNTSLNLIKMSISEGVALEYMPLGELNNYIDKKTNRYREIDKTIQEIKHIKGKEDYLIPKVIKNGLNMTLGDIKDLDKFLSSEKGFGDELNNLFKGDNPEMKSGIQNLENRVKEFSGSLKGGGEDIRENYKEIINTLEDLNNSFDLNENPNENMDNIQKYLKLQNKLEKDLVLQLPIEENGIYKNVNLIIPGGNRGIDKTNMLFYFNLNTENLGDIKVNLEVIEKDIYMEFVIEKDEIILNNKDLLEAGLNKIGYNLKELMADR